MKYLLYLFCFFIFSCARNNNNNNNISFCFSNYPRDESLMNKYGYVSTPNKGLYRRIIGDTTLIFDASKLVKGDIDFAVYIKKDSITQLSDFLSQLSFRLNAIDYSSKNFLLYKVKGELFFLTAGVSSGQKLIILNAYNLNTIEKKRKAILLLSTFFSGKGDREFYKVSSIIDSDWRKYILSD
jgi:hypothetical protein